MSEGRNEAGGTAAWRTVLAWTLFAGTVVLAPAGVVLTAVGATQDGDLAADWKSKVLLAATGGVAAVLFSLVGLLIARAEPQNAIGWIFLGAALLLGAVISAFGYTDVSKAAAEPWPGAGWVEWFGVASFIPAVFVAPVLIAQVFPDGRPLPGRWRWFLWISVVLAAESTVAAAFDPEVVAPQGFPFGLPDAVGEIAGVLNDGNGILAPAVFVGSLAALVVRFRRSRDIEREQMKWLAFAGAVPVSAFTLSFVLDSLVPEGLLIDVVFLTGFASLMLIPVAVAFAILRYRLYEIDRVISRALVYGSLTVLLGAAYVGLVLAGQAIFSSFAGGSSLAIAASTLAVAALFLPARSWVQRFVDHRFYRRRYDTQRTLEAFGGRLRHQVELDGLRADLEAAVRDTLHPAHVSVWLHPGGRP